MTDKAEKKTEALERGLQSLAKGNTLNISVRISFENEGQGFFNDLRRIVSLYEEQHPGDNP